MFNHLKTLLSGVSDPEPDPETRSESLTDYEELFHERETIRGMWVELYSENQDVFSPTPGFSLQSRNPDTSDPTSLMYLKLMQGGGFKVKIARKAKKKNLFRFLLAKGLYEEEGWHLDEYLVLWEVYLQLQDLLSHDPGFKEKYNGPLSRLEVFFEKFGSVTTFPCRMLVDHPRMKDLCSLFQPLLPSKSSYFGLKKQREIRLGFTVKFDFELPPSRRKDKRVIGVGYRDQGTKKPDEDGTPRLSEVAAHFQELEIRSEEEFQGVSREDPEFDWNRLWGLQEHQELEDCNLNDCSTTNF